MFLSFHMLLTTFRNPLVKTGFWKADVSNRVINALECPFIYFELMKVAAAEPCAPVVCTEECPLLVKMDFPNLTSLSLLTYSVKIITNSDLHLKNFYSRSGAEWSLGGTAPPQKIKIL